MLARCVRESSRYSNIDVEDIKSKRENNKSKRKVENVFLVNKIEIIKLLSY